MKVFLIFIFFLFSYSISFSSDLEDLPNRIDNIEKLIFKMEIYVEVFKYLLPFILGLIWFLWYKQYANVTSYIESQKNLIEKKSIEIDKLKIWTEFRFEMEDYWKLRDMEWEYTNNDHKNLKVKADILITKYNNLLKDNIISLQIIKNWWLYYLNILADAFFESDKFEEALNLLHISNQEDYNNHQTCYALAFTYEKLFELSDDLIKKELYLSKREIYIQKAVRLNPYETNYLCDLAFTYLQLWKEKEAVNIFTQAFKMDANKTRNYIAEFYNNYKKFFSKNEWKKLLKDFEIWKVDNIKNLFLENNT